jgi:YggT family protein
MTSANPSLVAPSPAGSAGPAFAEIRQETLALTRRLIQPIGGVDVTPVVWVGLISLLRELLVGQQGLLTLALLRSQLSG